MVHPMLIFPKQLTQSMGWIVMAGELECGTELQQLSQPWGEVCAHDDGPGGHIVPTVWPMGETPALRTGRLLPEPLEGRG